MFKGIFQRLLFTYSVLIAIIMVSLGLVLSTVFTVYYTRQKENTLLQQGTRISRLVHTAETRRTSPLEVVRTISTIGEATNTRIFLMEIDTMAREIFNLDISDPMFENEMQKLYKGESLVRKKHYLQQESTPVLLVVMPLRGEGRLKRVLIQYSPMDEIKNTVETMNYIIWGTALFFLVISSGLIYFISMKISRPIKQIGSAALRIAEGDFEARVNETGDPELRQLARSFNFMQGKLKNVEVMRRELIANVSHELRTPLASIRGFIHGMVDGIIPQHENDKYHAIILEEINRLTELIRDLLELAKYQAGNITLLLQLCNMMEVAEKVKGSLMVQAANKNIEIHIEGIHDELNILVDENRIKQVFINIVNNAIQYSHENGRIQISLKKEVGYVGVTVLDYGIGIPEEDLPYIFEKFHRVDKSRTPLTGGTGLGLSIAKYIIALHGGEINAKSRLGQGTTITFTIPTE